jgi:hypothetical protein
MDVYEKATEMSWWSLGLIALRELLPLMRLSPSPLFSGLLLSCIPMLA